ncbi:hypothetical protein HS088_TW07G01249 [Tripterygium wilfordii]|uniref:Expp1 protein n=2 Tax=Tripterygium wilfordii TaxID=458696 RepID=A0A7J7DH21_TRIWF|nr:hypothetical protein HS088_TW07G01249 [Tripterygium wilfordii]
MVEHTMAAMIVAMLMVVVMAANADDTNDVFNPCLDSKVQKSDGFTFGLAFSNKDSFFFNQVQLSPCDSRLALASKNAQLAVFRPKVDEISLLTINSSTFDPAKAGGFMVAFAGRKYAARSVPLMVADPSNTITSFTLVLEFQEGILQNLYWKSSGCDSCSGHPFVCLNKQDCAVATSQCKGHGGTIDCDLNIQLAFSGTDKSLEALNSWYEVSNLRQHSLYGLFSDVRDSITDPFDKLI